MKMTEQTVDILKNFSSINQSIQFKTGNVLKTMSVSMSILAEATVEETFPKECAIYDLNKFLAKLSIYKDPTLTFQEDKILLSTDDSRRSDSMKYCSPRVIKSLPPDKPINLGDNTVSFSLTEDDLMWMRRSAGISSAPHMIFESDGDSIWFVAKNLKDDSSDESKNRIGDGTGTPFKVVMQIENFKMIHGAYQVTVCPTAAKFAHTTINLVYYIAIDSDMSKIGE